MSLVLTAILNILGGLIAPDMFACLLLSGIKPSLYLNVNGATR